MVTPIVANSTVHANPIELSWESIMAGQFTTSPARRLFEETVISRAASAKAALPGESSRIDRGRDLVLANRVLLNADGSFTVHSTSERGKSYPVTAAGCTCPDVAKAPEGRCKHLLATWIWRKARSAVSGQELPPTTAGASNGQHAAQEAPQATNGTQGDPQAIPPQLTLEEEVEESVRLAANRPAPQPPLPEAASSINLYITIGGYKAQLTLRDMDETRLLTRLEALLKRFPAPEEPPQTPAKPAEPAVPEGWWSHRLADGSWCKGKGKSLNL